MGAQGSSDDAGRENATEGLNWGLILDVFDALERHGHRRGDDLAVGRAIGMLGAFVETYEGKAGQ